MVSRTGRRARRGTSRRSGRTAKRGQHHHHGHREGDDQGPDAQADAHQRHGHQAGGDEARQRVISTRRPAKPSRAGSSVSEATSVVATTAAVPSARPVMKLTCMTSMPSSEITTVVPANSTARPAVSMAMTVERSRS